MKTQSTIAGIPRDLVGVAVRLAVYTTALLGVYGLLPEAAGRGDFDIFKEGGPIEWCQFSVLAVTAAVFAFAAWRIQAFSQWLAFLALVTTFACVRELDSLFDALLPPFGWKLPAFLVAGCVLLMIWKNPKGFVTQAGAFIRHRSFGILWAGFVVAVVFAQLVGHASFLKALMGDDYIRDYKRVIEELGELFGYALLLIGSLETVVDAVVAQRGISRQTHLSAIP